MKLITIDTDPIRVAIREKSKELVSFTNFDEYVKYVQEHPEFDRAMCSSSMDWPWDYDDMTGEIVKICNLVRGNTVPLTREEDQYDDSDS